MNSTWKGLITLRSILKWPLQWRHNERDGISQVSKHQPHDCFLNCLFRRRSKQTSKLCVTGLCVGNSLMTGEFPAQRARNVENVSIWWRHHGKHTLRSTKTQATALHCLTIGPLYTVWIHTSIWNSPCRKSSMNETFIINIVPADKLLALGASLLNDWRGKRVMVNFCTCYWNQVKIIYLNIRKKRNCFFVNNILIISESVHKQNLLSQWR